MGAHRVVASDDPGALAALAGRFDLVIVTVNVPLEAGATDADYDLVWNGWAYDGTVIANEAGTPIYATADGVVRHSGWAHGYGMCSVVDHGFGYSTLYGHMSEIVAKEGTPVKRGQIIGRMGSTGTSTGNHLHYEVWTGGLPRNPMKFLQVGEKHSGSFAGLFDGIFRGL